MPPARSKARKRALDILFEAEQRGTPVLDLLAERITLGSPPVPGYAADLVRGVAVHTARIDELISQYAEGWTCLLYTSPSPRDTERSRMPSSA